MTPWSTQHDGVKKSTLCSYAAAIIKSALFLKGKRMKNVSKHHLTKSDNLISRLVPMTLIQASCTLRLTIHLPEPGTVDATERMLVLNALQSDIGENVLFLLQGTFSLQRN